MPVPSLVYLTGPMASGKSTVGPLLADALGVRFVDLDWLVEARTGQTVADLFVTAGEDAFRIAEAGALAETTRGEPAVIATGGGALVAPTNLQTARSAGAVVYLRASAEAIAVRLGATDLRKRPLLCDEAGAPLQGAALQARIQSLLDARALAYARADLTVDASGPPDAVADAVARALRHWHRGAHG